MRIAVLSPNYHTVRVFEMLLERERHTVVCFGKLAQLERSKHTFDLLLFDPANPGSVEVTLQRLVRWRPNVRRILFTHSAEVSALARQKKQTVLFLPCSRRLLLALIQEKKALEQEEFSHGS